MKTLYERYKRYPRILLIIFLLLVAGLISTGYLLFRNYEKEYRTEVRNQLSSIADLKAGDLIQWRKERLADAGLFFKNPAFSALAQRYLEHPDDVEAQEQLRTWLGNVQDSGQYETIMLLDSQYAKKLVVPEGPERPVSYVSQITSGILQSGQVVFEDFYYNEENKEIYLKVMVPILGQANDRHVIGSLAMRIDPHTYLYPLIKRWSSPRQMAEALITRVDGNDILFLNDLKFQKDAALQLRIPLEKRDFPSVKVALGQEGIMEGVDYRGVPVIADARRIPDSPWIMVALIDKTEAYAPPMQMLWAIAAVIGALIIGVGAGLNSMQRGFRFAWEQAEVAYALRDSEEKYRTILDEMEEGYYELDLAGNWTFLNDAFCRNQGYSREELIGMNYEVATIKDDIDTARRIFEEVYRTGKPAKAFSLGTLCKDGSIRFIEASASPRIDEKGNIIGFRGVGYDITERKQAEKNIDRLNSVLRALRNVNQLITKENDRDKLLKAACDNLTKTRGYHSAWIALFDDAGKSLFTAESGLGKAFLPLLEQLQRGELTECGRHVLRQPGLFIKDESTECADCPLATTRGKKVAMAARLEYGTKTYGMLAVSLPTDLTPDMEEQSLFQELVDDIAFGLYKIETGEQRKQVEDALRESEEKYRNLVELLHEGIWVIDEDSRTTYINTHMAGMLGYTVEEMQGKELFSFMDERGRKLAAQNVERRREGISETHDFEFLRKDGTRIYTSLSASPITDKYGVYKGAIAGIQDSTDRKRLEEEQQRVEKLESVGLLAGGIAHDFNNILTAILGNISLAKMEAAPGSELQNSLEQAEKASLRAKGLTKQLITFSRGGAPVTKLTSLTELLKNTASFALSGSKVKCQFSIVADLWHAEIDAGQVSQVMHNLVINAQQAMPTGGSIELRAENMALSEMQSLGKWLPLKEGDYIRITVTDHGTGMPAEHLEKIFDPFFSTKQEGSGLGLATSFSIARQHGGHISVKSELGSGSTFSLYLPASMETSAPKQEKEKAIKAVGKARILVMDDEKGIREVTGRMLKHLGYEDIEFAADGAGAIKLYEAAMESGQPFSAVILDLTIPGGMGGKETIRKLLRIDPGVKAIVSSGYVDKSVMAKYREYRFSGMVVKPYTLEELSQALRDVIG